MTSRTVAQTKVVIKITIQRAGHFYTYSRQRDGEVEIKRQVISRETADMVIREHNDGLLPDGVNLDVCHGRDWIWVKEVFAPPAQAE